MAVAAAASAYGNIARVADNGQKLIHQSGNMNSLPNYALPLPSPPSFHNLEDIADILVSAQVCPFITHTNAHILPFPFHLTILSTVSP
jgi:hypothetical protein